VTADVVIVGGGAIGLSVAYVLACEGVAVRVLDRGAIGGESSWAGAGIISPGAERPSPLPASQLRTLSARMHAEWAERLRAETGIDNGYRRTGGVDVALDDRDVADLGSAAGRWRDEGIAFERMAPSDFHRVEPALSPIVRCAYFLPDRAQIRNPRHIRALEVAVRGRGGSVQPGVGVEGFEVQNGRVARLRTTEGPIACGVVVVAAGAWSGPLVEILGMRVVTPPVRGQIALLNPGRPVIRRIIEHGKRYLVPRDEGRILVGSTEEHVGFAKVTTPEAITGLAEFARTICPILVGAPIEKHWAGLRPGSVDTRPYLGPAPGFNNLFLATGHNRAGLQLAPGSAAMIAAMVLGRDPAIDPRAFRLDRQPSEDRGDAFRS